MTNDIDLQLSWEEARSVCLQRFQEAWAYSSRVAKPGIPYVVQGAAAGLTFVGGLAGIQVGRAFSFKSSSACKSPKVSSPELCGWKTSANPLAAQLTALTINKWSVAFLLQGVAYACKVSCATPHVGPLFGMLGVGLASAAGGQV